MVSFVTFWTSRKCRVGSWNGCRTANGYYSDVQLLARKDLVVVTWLNRTIFAFRKRKAKIVWF